MEYVYYDDEGDYEDNGGGARSSKALQGQGKVDRLDTAETSYAKNRLRDEPHLAKAAKARLAAKGYGGNRDDIQCHEILPSKSIWSEFE